MMWGYEMGWGGWLLMGLMMVAFWSLVIFVIVAMFRGSSGFSRPGGGAQRRSADEGARRILDERFARGDIDQQDYQARLAALEAAR